jgi:hypothetical protein
MSWLASLLIALVSGVVGLLGGGFAATLAVDWYRISSFEGGSGYFVVLLALFAGVVSTVVGLVLSRVLAHRAGLASWTNAAATVGIVLTVIAGIGGLARLLADVPPEIDGETLYLLVEVRFAPGLPVPTALEARPTVRLGAMSGTSIRRDEEGPLWLDDKRREGESWVVPGMVEIFTARGGRLLSVPTASGRATGTRIALPAHPDARQTAWSDWSTEVADAPVAERVSFRFRVVRRSEAARRHHVGTFQVDTLVDQLYWEAEQSAMSARSRFVLHHRGQLVALPETSAVSVVRRSPTVLLARHASGCVLVAADEQHARVIPLEPCGSDTHMLPVTSDSTRFRAARDVPRVAGWLDTRTFADGGAFLLDGGVLWSDTLRYTPITWPETPRRLAGLPPLAFSPDGQSLAWFADATSDSPPHIVVTHLETSETASVAIDRTRQRFRTPQLDIDPDWFAHYYTWQPQPRGPDILVVRDDAVPRPFRGALQTGPSGSYQAYTLQPAGRRLQEAVRAALLAHGGTPRPDMYGSPQVRIGGVDYGIQLVEGTASVSVFTFSGTPEAIARIGEQLDADIATGHLDALFVADPPAAQP